MLNAIRARPLLRMRTTSLLYRPRLNKRLDMASPVRKRPRVDPEHESGGEPGMASKTRVVLALCGSMSPITYLHLRMFELARDWLNSSGKYSVEAGIISPVHDAYGKKGLVDGKHRLAMCKLAVKSSDWVRVESWELQQSAWTETAKVLIHYQSKISAETNGEAKLKLLCGADLLESFATPNLWADQDMRDIVEQFGLVVISRFGSNPEKFIYESDQLTPLKSYIDIVTEWIPNDVSSTKIRRSLRRGESVKYLIPDEVIEYIKEHKLYQANT